MRIKITRTDGQQREFEGTYDFMYSDAAYFKYRPSGSDEMVNLIIPWRMISEIEVRGA